MTQEEKELLLKDLCGRLPYKPIVHAKWSYRETNGELKHKEADRKLEINDFYSIWDVKLYLRPMSSMTEDEKNELSHYDNSVQRIDFFYSHHIDCRFMIEKGLALEAPEGMYNIQY